MMFIQHCVVPRVMFSPTDAMYCCKFAKLLIEMGTPSFSSLVFFDKVLKLLVNRVRYAACQSPPLAALSS